MPQRVRGDPLRLGDPGGEREAAEQAPGRGLVEPAAGGGGEQRLRRAVPALGFHGGAIGVVIGLRIHRVLAGARGEHR